MSNQECKEMMNKSITDEEKRPNLNSQIFLKRHHEFIDEANRQLYDDLMMEQQETM